jgi:hypothetical protein
VGRILAEQQISERNLSPKVTPILSSGLNSITIARSAELAPLVSNGSPAPAVSIAATHHDEDEDVLDELEDGIDELIQKLRELGGKPKVVKALKRARRLLVRIHEG